MIEWNNRMIRVFSIKSIAFFPNDVRRNFFLSDYFASPPVIFLSQKEKVE